MQDSKFVQSDSTLSAADYLTVMLQEYATLRSEIKLRINMRNGILVASFVAIISNLLTLPSSKEASGGTGQSLFLVVFPIIWYVLFILQAVLLTQIERAARVICGLEMKSQLLFEKVGDTLVKKTMTYIEDEMPKLSKKKDLARLSWGDPLVWERLLRSGKRFYDHSRWRNGVLLLVAAILSSSGAIFFSCTVKIWWLWTVCWILGYIVVAVVVWMVLSCRWAFGGIAYGLPVTTDF